MILIAGLGNPGNRYRGTRHNIGFDVIDSMVDNNPLFAKQKFKNCDVWRGNLFGKKVLLVKPQTYMNLSGQAIGAICRYYRIDTKQVVVIHDELDFDVGEVRLKNGGGAGGHNGLRSIIRDLDGDFARIRIGIGRPHGKISGADFVLSRFDTSQEIAIDRAIEDSVKLIEEIIDSGVAKTLQRINKKR